ncbi:hypothetical protein BGZ98_002019 [Dissophora globulifera]|nr:hypothetical protein BGZ98_002019 [Dissophora globulifera]
MIVALVATMAMAAPSTSDKKKVHPTTVAPHHKKAAHPMTGVHHHAIHHLKPIKKATTTTKKATTTTKKPTTTTKKPTTTTKKPTTTTKKAATTTKKATTTTKKATTTTKKATTTTKKATTDFCIFLPPKVGGDIALNEDRAIAFCTKPMASAPGAKIIPPGFLKTVHFQHNTTANWVQVTGRIDRSKYSLSPNDGGGQYDMRAPVGASCAGYTSFVQLTEPDAEIYCIRCCMTKTDCPVNKSTHGCEKVLGGSYA